MVSDSEVLGSILNKPKKWQEWLDSYISYEIGSISIRDLCTQRNKELEVISAIRIGTSKYVV